MNYEIAIPSYKRALILKNRTLFLLFNYGFKPKQIRIFVESEEMKQEYINIIGDSYNYEVHQQEGIGATRNYIREFYYYDTSYKYVLCLDDDIEKIIHMNNKLEDLKELVNLMFTQCEQRNLYLWGVNNLHNTFYMKDKITSSFKYIAGALFGIIIDRDKYSEPLSTDFNHYEDFHFSCQHYLRDYGVLRHNGIALRTKYFEVGGICESYGGEEKRKQDMIVAGIRFNQKYPDMSKIITKNYGKDIQLNSRYRILKPMELYTKEYNYTIVIPSYKRKNLLKSTTLKLLENIKAPIHLLLSEGDDYDVSHNIKKILAPNGIGNVRNFIRQKYNGRRIIMIDDDIDSIDILINNKLEPVKDLNKLINYGFQACEENMSKIWAVNLFHNAFYCRDSISTKICYMNGSFTGLDLTGNEEPLKTSIDHFEDFDFTIQHYIRDGAVCKLNNICLKTKCFRANGGIAEQVGGLDKRKQTAFTNGTILEAKYSNYCKLYAKKKFNVYNLKLFDKS